MTFLETFSIAQTAIGRLRLTRWQIFKLIVRNIWSSIPLLQLLQWTLALAVVGWATLIIYRLYFHPLAKYPGPKLAAMSRLWFARSWYGGKYFQDIEQLHRQYGPFVRTAPDELSIATTSSYRDIYTSKHSGNQNFAKSDFYEVGAGESNIVSERDVAKHREIRRLLAPGFTTLAVAKQENLIHAHVDAWTQQLERRAQGEPVDMIEWWRFLTFDITGELTLGEPFGTITTAQNHIWIKTIQETGRLWGFAAICHWYPILWPLLLLIAPANLRSSFARHTELTRTKLRSRIARHDQLEHADFFDGLLSEKSADQSEKFMLAQAVLLVIAGADTTSLTLTGITYFLLQRPSTWQRLRDEVREAFRNQDVNNERLQSLPYLNAVIQEGLRLLPAIPIGLTRESPGAVVDGEYIPKGTVVSTAHWTLAHSDKFFKDPYTFCPERWLSTSHPYYEAKFDGDDRSASRPFSLGSRSCLGERLAHLEMRIALAKMALAFDLELANGDEIDWYKGIKLEGFLSLPRVLVRFKSRPKHTS